MRRLRIEVDDLPQKVLVCRFRFGRWSESERFHGCRRRYGIEAEVSFHPFSVDTHCSPSREWLAATGLSPVARKTYERNPRMSNTKEVVEPPRRVSDHEAHRLTDSLTLPAEPLIHRTANAGPSARMDSVCLYLMSTRIGYRTSQRLGHDVYELGALGPARSDHQHGLSIALTRGKCCLKRLSTPTSRSAQLSFVLCAYLSIGISVISRMISRTSLT